MKMTPDDPALTAYALGELSKSEAAPVAAALARDPLLAKEGAAISSLAGLLSGTLGGEEFSLGEERRTEIFKAGRRPDADVLVLDHRKRSRRQSMMAVVGVAAVVTAGFVGLSKMGVDKSAATGTGESAGAGQVIAPNIEEEEKGQVANLNPAVEPSVHLVLNTAVADPAFVEKSLSTTGELPPREQFKVGPWINLTPVAAEPQVRIGDIGVCAELGNSPWDDARTLVMVTMRPLSAGQKSTAIKASLNFNPDRVKSARLVGADPTAKNSSEEITPVALSSAQTFLYELELLPGEVSLGSVNLFSDEGEGYLPLSTEPREVNSSDFGVAVVLARYAKWAASQERESEILSELADETRELLSEVTDEKARYALDMILLCEER